MSDDYESILLVKQEVFVYRIPPLASSRGHKAADWKLDSPDYVCRLRIVSRGDKVELKLEDKSSGELFAKCPVDSYPGQAVEPVVDSSRYFVIRLQDENGRTALIGIGFADRGDSFDLNVALQDHFRYIGKAAQINNEQAQGVSNQTKLDLSFKEGQTVTLNIGKKGSSTGNATSRPRSAGLGNVGGPVPLLPPPPTAGSRIAASSPQQSGGITKGRGSPSGAISQQQQALGSGAGGQSFNPFLSNSGGSDGKTALKTSSALLDFDAFASALPPAQSTPANNPFLGAERTSDRTRELNTSATAPVGNLLDL